MTWQTLHNFGHEVAWVAADPTNSNRLYAAVVHSNSAIGGIWVTVNMRGGAEYGESWHKAGYLEKKQNVFDDFIAVAEYLAKEKYTSPSKLGIMGGSNGGLLVGAVQEQRPRQVPGVRRVRRVRRVPQARSARIPARI